MSFLRFFYLFCLCLPITAAAQTEQALKSPPNSISWAFDTHYGMVWKHTPKMTVQTGKALFGQEFGIRIQTGGRRIWHQWHRFPSFGLMLMQLNVSDAAHGQIWGILPNISIPLSRNSIIKPFFRVGTGAAWVSRPYSYFNNPTQNAIGSHWNTSVQFRFSAEAQLHPSWILRAGAGLTHVSNGGVILPNFGLNIPSAFVGLEWKPARVMVKPFAQIPLSKKPQGRRWGLIAAVGLAKIEFNSFDGPRYPVWHANLSVYRMLKTTNRLSLGLDYEYNGAISNWRSYTGDFKTQTEARMGATRIGATLSEEFLFGSFSIHLLAGYYVGPSTINRYTLEPWYCKLGVRYYLPSIKYVPFRAYAGICLKSHVEIAEYVSWQTGLLF